MDGPTFTAGNEGLSLVAYRDSLGYWTIGRGHKLGQDGGGTIWTEQQAADAFVEDYETATNGAIADAGMVCWSKLNEPRQAVLVDMAFELGEIGLGKFHQMLAALLVQDWLSAKAALLASLYDAQVPARANRNALIIETGNWPNA